MFAKRQLVPGAQATCFISFITSVEAELLPRNPQISKNIQTTLDLPSMYSHLWFPWPKSAMRDSGTRSVGTPQWIRKVILMEVHVLAPSIRAWRWSWNTLQVMLLRKSNLGHLEHPCRAVHSVQSTAPCCLVFYRMVFYLQEPYQQKRVNCK